MGLQKGKEIFKEILLDAKGSVCLLLQFSLGKKYKVFQEAYQNVPKPTAPTLLPQSRGLLFLALETQRFVC